MIQKKRSEQLRYLVLAAVLSTMTYVLTAFVHIPTHQGYIHVGDSVIYLAASLLPLPYAMLTGAIGAGLSDYLSGYPLWILPTVLIKALTALAFSRSKPTIINRRNLMGLIPAALLGIGGYYLAGALLYGSWITALADMPTNALQCVGSAALFIFLGLSLDKMSFKERFLLTIRKNSGHS